MNRFCSDAIDNFEYNLHWTCQNRQHGVEIAIHKSLDILIDNILHQTEKPPTFLFVISDISWCPNWKNVVSEKEKLYTGFAKLRVLGKYIKLCMSGDFNALLVYVNTILIWWLEKVTLCKEKPETGMGNSCSFFIIQKYIQS